jgi:ribonucleoside-diphosphate reductase alpha chain
MNTLIAILETTEKIPLSYRQSKTIEEIKEDLKEIKEKKLKITNSHVFNLFSLLFPEEKYVSKIEEGEEKLTLDLEILDNSHSYIANGIPVHNTVNLPMEYKFEDFKNVYLDGWKRGLIGLTTYREGTMESVLSKIGDSKDSKEQHTIKKQIKLPSELINGSTKIIKKEGIKFYIHFSYLPEDNDKKYPVAIWITTNHYYSGEAVYVNRAIKSLYDLLIKYEVDSSMIEKQFEKMKANMPNSKLAKSISMCLRHNLPIESIIAALENLEGDNISSLLTAVRKFLAQHVPDGTPAVNKVCHNCKGTRIIYEAKCTRCLDCGSGDCG